MKYIVTLNGKQYEVDVEKGQANAVLLGDAAAPAAAPQQTGTAPTQAPGQALAMAPKEGAAVVVCPLPGTVFDVRCSVGQSVKAGEILFIIEAMKMENEILAPRDGVVSAVYVQKGASVDTDTPLCAL